METKPGTCDLYRGKKICRDFSAGNHSEPEFIVREVIASFLNGCDGPRDCTALDVGMSTGYFTGMMAAMGARVTSVERSTDMVEAFKDTIKANCWEGACI